MPNSEGGSAIPAVSAALCPGPDRQPGSGDAYVAATLEALIADRPSSMTRGARGSRSIGCSPKSGTRSPSTARRGSPRRRCRASRSSPISRRCPARPFCWSRSRAFRSRDAARVLDIDVVRLRGSGRGIRPRAGGRNRHRRADHRGRHLHRHGARNSGGGPGSSRARRRAHPRRGSGADQEEEARPDPRRHPARRRQFGARCGQRTAARRSRCR